LSDLETSQRLKGIALMCAAAGLFICLDATGKYLSRELPIIEVVWGRYLAAFLLTLVISNPVTRPGLTRTARPLLQVGRSALVVLSTGMNFLALRYLQLDQTMSIAFSTPFMVAVLAGPLLGECVGWRRWAAICVGFCGVLVVTRPGAGGIHPAALLTLGASVCYAFYLISTRLLARTDSNETTLFYSNLVGAVVMSVLVPFVWVPPSGAFPVFLLIAMGVFGGMGHFLLIAAHRMAPAAVLAPFSYTQVVWAVAVGYLVFGDLPNQWTVAGGSIVVSAGLYLIHRERRRGGGQPKEAA
jgi:drug/metabolite transporter (DMT)-like permease